VDPDGVVLIFVQVPETHPLRRDTRLRREVQRAGDANGQPTEANREAT
jgi:hypothetical protein